MTEKRQSRFETMVDFSSLTPKAQIEKVEINPAYEKAFLDKDEKPSSEYNKNETTWD